MSARVNYRVEVLAMAPVPLNKRLNSGFKIWRLLSDGSWPLRTFNCICCSAYPLSRPLLPRSRGPRNRHSGLRYQTAMGKSGVRNAKFILGLDEVPTWEKSARLYCKIRHRGLKEIESTTSRMAHENRRPGEPVSAHPTGSREVRAGANCVTTK